MSLGAALRQHTIRALLLLYPRAWRQRYGAEFAALLAQRRLMPREILDITYAALDAHRRVRRPARDIGREPSSFGTRSLYVERLRAHDGRERDVARVSRHFVCSFCGKSQDQVRRLIAGPKGVYICDECVSLCNEIIAQGQHETPSQRTEGTLSPGRQQAAPRWQRIVRRWLESGRGERLRMTARHLIAGAGPSRA